MRLKILREYSGFSRREFGELFCSKEYSVYEWETGYCIPQIIKLMNISMYFDVSMDCILYGRAIAENKLEETLSKLSEISDDLHSNYTVQILKKINSMPSHCKERLLGYMDALYHENI